MRHSTIAVIAAVRRWKRSIVGRRLARRRCLTVTNDRKRVDRGKPGRRPNAPRGGLQRDYKGCHRSQRLSDASLHVFVGPCRQPTMDIDAAAFDKFPKERASPCVLASDPLSVTALFLGSFKDHAPVPLFPADPARNTERGGDRLASIDAARRDDAAGGRGHLRISATRIPRAAEDLSDRPRGAEPIGCERTADAHHSVG